MEQLIVGFNNVTHSSKECSFSKKVTRDVLYLKNQCAEMEFHSMVIGEGRTEIYVGLMNRLS
jgi:hypothetical protein